MLGAILVNESLDIAFFQPEFARLRLAISDELLVFEVCNIVADGFPQELVPCAAFALGNALDLAH
jgi:hypothetical protein